MAKKKKKKSASREKTVKKIKKVAKKKVSATKKKKVAVKTKPVAAVKTAPKATGAAPTATVGYQPAANETKLGGVEDYFSHIGVIALNLNDNLSIGDTIHLHGHTTDFTQKVDSIQINHAPVQNAKKGDSVGIKVTSKCRKGDTIYRIS